jgi:membrane protein insertase Oxa1/YidC/SpoIIIJ
LWFKDLSAPDPTGILPIIGGFISLLNVMSSSAAVQNQMFRNFSKFMRLMPFISIPIWMTFPAAFNIYWIVNSGFQLALVSVVRSERFRKYLGIP